jgi:adenosylcobinamide-phosphate synthase
LESPNSGWSKAAFAGALRVRLLGPISYEGQLSDHDFIGDPHWPADLERWHLEQAMRLVLVSALLALALGLPLAAIGQITWAAVAQFIG